LGQRDKNVTKSAVALVFATQDTENALDLVAWQGHGASDRSVPKIAIEENSIAPNGE
jgi:hypothetical protein